MCKISKHEIYDIIYNMEETIDKLFDKEPASILYCRLQEQRNNKFRESIILLK